jgi:hypothetical protein
MYNGYYPDVQSHLCLCDSQIVHSSNFVSSSNANIKKIPVRIIMNDDEEVENRSIDTDSHSFYKTDRKENKSKYCIYNINTIIFLRFNFLENTLFDQNINSGKIVYIFKILKSRKKEKKYLRKKFNKVVSRVHNMDCLLKKIKA